MFHQFINFFKRAFVKEQVQPLASRELASGFLPRLPLGAPSTLSLNIPTAEFFELFLKCHEIAMRVKTSKSEREALPGQRFELLGRQPESGAKKGGPSSPSTDYLAALFKPLQFSQAMIELPGWRGSYFTLEVAPGRIPARSLASAKAEISCAASYITPATS